jgi:predicted DCC family thiol-disulfide oxidoreductase YuxK
MASPKLIYDGACGICRALSERTRWFDPECRWEVLPYQSIEEADLRKMGLTVADCARAVQVVNEEGRRFAGPWAINYLLWQRWPGRWLVALFFVLPPLLLLEWIGYRLVARYRSHFSRWFGLTSCSLPTPPVATGGPPSRVNPSVRSQLHGGETGSVADCSEAKIRR